MPDSHDKGRETRCASCTGTSRSKRRARCSAEDRPGACKGDSAVVRGSQSIQSEPKVWLDLQGDTALPETHDFSDINFADINHAVSGFQGGAYPFATPCDCPRQSCPYRRRVVPLVLSY